MTLLFQENEPRSWAGFTDFRRVPSNQGQVWRGTHENGDIAYLKQHPNGAAYARERDAYLAIEHTKIAPELLTYSDPFHALLVADGGVHPVAADPTLGRWISDGLRQLHGIAVQADSMPAVSALRMRWARRYPSVSPIFGPEIHAWVADRMTVFESHARGWTHRDVRPVNVCVSEMGI